MATPSTAPAESIAFVLKLGRALHTYGTPAHRLEETMTQVSRALGLQGQFFSAPTAIFSTFELPDGDRTYLQRIETSEVDLSKLAALDDLAARVLRGAIPPGTAHAAVEDIQKAAPRYPAPWSVLAFGLASAAAARFFQGGLYECAVAGADGLLVGLLALAAQRVALVGRLFEALAAALVSFVTLLAARWLPISAPVATLSGIIVLMPGLTLTVAITEFALRNLVSGTARFAAAVTVFLLLGFGVALGGGLGVACAGQPAPVEPLPLPYWTELAAFAVASLSFTILFRAPPRDLPWILLVCGLAYAGVRGGGEMLRPEFAVFSGALLVGVASNGYSRLLRRPTAITRVPGMMLLVPGGLGFLSVSSLLEQDVTAGVQTAFTALLIAVALVTGLLIASLVIPPREFA